MGMDSYIGRVTCGDCLDILPQLDLVDAVITDPPYGLNFMGKDWDHGVPGVVFWEAILDRMKPGAHLFAFGGTRTHHRLMVAIEDAGFEIRDVLMWVYGSGFPKSLDVSKAIDKVNGEDGRTQDDFGFASPEVKGRTWEGRWPANFIHDGSDEVVELFPDSKDGVAIQRNRDGQVHNEIYGAYAKPPKSDVGYGGGGSAARFFYCAKASKKERGENNNHPTVKPLALIQYLCNLITPPNGIILDPFAGSGTTGIAAIKLNRRFILIEQEPKYCAVFYDRVAKECNGTAS